MSSPDVDRTPRFSGEVDADVVDVKISEVSGSGWAGVDTSYAHHLAAWVPLEDGASFHTTSYNQNRKEDVQTVVNTDGGVNIGTEEWAGKRVAVFILDETAEE